MTSTKPSPSLLRELSDEAVLRALMDAPRLTRAEVAVVTKLSKPTAAESIRRLESAGLVRDTGERTTGRGGVGSYYALADVGVALAVSIAPSGIVAEQIDTAGQVTARHIEAIGRPAAPRAVARTLAKAARGALVGIDPAAVRVAVVSVADPVDRTTGALVHLPDAPFLLGRLSPAAVLASMLDGPVIVDNDVNWEARAEREAQRADSGASVDDFVYLHLGEGLGCAVVADGEVRRGRTGLAGEIAHLVTTGTEGQAIAFTDVFEQLGLRHAESTAIDVDALTAAISGPHGRSTLSAIARAVGDVITAAIGLCDPEFVVIGGEWGSEPRLFAIVQEQLRKRRRSVPLRQASGHSVLVGVRGVATGQLRADLIRRSRVDGMER